MKDLTATEKEEAAQLLVSMLAAAPPLANELGELLDALDEGETVFVGGVKDATLRSQLAAFLTALGLAAPAGKGNKSFRCSGGGVLRGVAALMDEQDLADPLPLDREAAFNSAKEVVDRLAGEQGMEGVREEVPGLLDQILGGELVMLEGLPDERVRAALTLLFEAIGLKSRTAGDGGEAGYGIPDRGYEDSEAVIKKVIAEYGGEQSKPKDSSDDEGGENDGPAPRRAPIGPAMPSQAMLAQAQQAAKDFVQEDSSSDDDEDQFGPSIAGKEKRVASERADPNRAKRQKRQELKRAAEWENATGVITGGQAALDKAEAEVGREEWMLVPPKSLGVLGAIKTLQPTNRKFQTRSARGARADLHAPKAPKSKAEMEAEAAAEELMAKHREARGASLVERHASDVSKAKKAAGGGDGGKKSFSWSREEDFEQRKKFTPQMYEELVQKSQELDSKFSRSISRNFL
ncbi:expressed unknown protein [Ectocarpus siliculosus]|uniref:DUF3752 domain-containing protein n=1 Tax=Ectocarpus siliculosus TaxID=2880 RepID=D7FYT2_ECTSI|nr:expressed unknown protein [Ectocarpus siliculosus]|eukprot:CBJ26574.1 expressed unknown protein [Ectocarpus siliculosus]